MRLALAALVMGLSIQEGFRFRVDVARVHVDVFVSRRGAPLDELSAKNFEVFDQGARQEVTLVDAAEIPHSFALLLDESGSIDPAKRDQLRQAAGNLAGRLRAGDELAVLGFAERLSLLKPFANNSSVADVSGFELRGKGWTAFNDAIFLSLAYLRNARGRPILVVFSDGIDNASWIRDQAVLKAARESEAVVYGVKADSGHSDRGSDMFRELTSLTGGRWVAANRPDAIDEVVNEIVSELAARYILAFTPAEGSEPGWRELRVQITGMKDVEVRARKGYFLPAGDR